MNKDSTGYRSSKPNRNRKIWLIIAGVLLLVLVAGGVEAYRILYTPQNLFTFSTMSPTTSTASNATPLPTPEVIGPEDTEEPESTVASVTPADVPTDTAKTDVTGKKDILNVLLIGIDRNEDGGKSSGTDPHADVMMVIAINFKEKKVDLISLPRDTFIHAPDIMNGIYKLNGSFNVGGGFGAKNGGGFLKVRDAAEYMLGGIPINYYYAVDFKALVSIVDTIGGVDYDVESSAYTLDGVGGKRHLSGEDVLYYLRVRKVGPEKGDSNRVNRQKKMMIAIFSQLKKDGKLSMMPDLINAANSGIYTNTTLEQTLAIANIAASIKMDAIGMHSMSGALLIKAGWAYCFTDQKARRALIKQIYGIDVPNQVHCSSRYADWLMDYGLSGIRFQKTTKQLLDYATAHEAGLTADGRKAYDLLKTSYASAQAAYARASLTFANADNRTLADEKNKLKANTEALAKLLGYKDELKWTCSSAYWNDPAINEVLVDFR